MKSHFLTFLIVNRQSSIVNPRARHLETQNTFRKMLNYKMSIIRLLIAFFLFVISLGSAFGQVSDVPVFVTPEQRYGREIDILYDEIASSFGFLRETVSVKGKAMGDAFVAVADDGAAINANNAGIAQIRQPHLLVFNPVSLDINGTSFLGYVHPVAGLSSLGTSVTFIRTPKYGEESTIVTAAYSWSLQTEGDAYLGLGVKGFSRRSDAFDTNGIAFDIGLWVRFFESNLSLGIAAQNIGPEIRLKVNDTQKLLQRAGLESAQLPASLVLPNKIGLPYNVKFGIAYKAQPRQFPLLLAGELDVPSVGFTRLSLGGEFWLPGLFAIRFGYSSQSDKRPRYTVGLGFRADWIKWGYSYVINDDVQDKHQVYLSANFE